ncbi:MAG: hypothetical protein IK125_10145 [Lachnospiraceae bacterium]|nr:hypothetical protein [Lachnospiraceae bacterium]
MILSFYPLLMGARVIRDMIVDGTVMKENYPKYIIPYTPIAFAVIIGILLMPLIVRFFKWVPTVVASVLSIGAFFGFELLFENKVVVTSTETVTKTVSRLADWQMFMCRYIPPEEYKGYDVITSTSIRTETPIDLLIGNYNPAFKLHFYLISVVLILAILNSVYGFAQMIKTGDGSRKRVLILQSICVTAFLGLCILACFTAFWRDGNINVSPLSATLMSVFFILLGVTVGIFFGSLLLKKNKGIALWISTVLAVGTTLVMYIGEMILLHAHLYRFGTGFFFDGLPGIILAPVDIIVILAAGVVTYFLMRFVAIGGSQDKL